MPHELNPAILYVDDEAVNLRVFEANFRQTFRVIAVASAAEALKQIEAHGDEIALVISDQRMPGMSGVELLEKVRELAPDAARMLITAFSDMQAVIDAVNRGQVRRYFVKPWAREELQNAMADAVRIFVLQYGMRQLELRILKSERLATIGQVSAGVAHELLNPLGYISQNVEVLRGELATLSDYVKPLLTTKPDKAVSSVLAEIPSILDDIEAGTRHLRAVGDKLKAQARGDGEHSCDVQAVALFAEKITRSDIRRYARVDVKGEAVRVALPEVDLTQILLNLLVNAGHAMQAAASRSGVIEVRWSVKAGKVELEVEDNGAGISEENQKKLFQPLFTTKPSGVGTGLGLSTCRELIRAVGGEIRVRSTPGAGTTFTLELPQPKS